MPTVEWLLVTLKRAQHQPLLHMAKPLGVHTRPADHEWRAEAKVDQPQVQGRAAHEMACSDAPDQQELPVHEQQHDRRWYEYSARPHSSLRVMQPQQTISHASHTGGFG